VEKRSKVGGSVFPKEHSSSGRRMKIKTDLTLRKQSKNMLEGLGNSGYRMWGKQLNLDRALRPRVRGKR